MRRTGVWIPLLALASIFFGWRAYEAWRRPLGTAGNPPPNPQVTPIGILQEAAPPPPDLSATVASIVAKPIFRPDRQPFREEPAAQIPKRNYEAEIGRFSLLGVLLLGDVNKAVVTLKSTGRPERYEVGPGDSLPGFEVKEIREEGVLLAADGKEFLLPLYAGAPKAQGPGGLRTELSSPKAPPAALPAVPPRPAAGPAAGPGTAEPGMAPVRSQPPAVGAVPGQPSSPPPPNRFRGRARPSYQPGQR